MAILKSHTRHTSQTKCSTVLRGCERAYTRVLRAEGRNGLYGTNFFAAARGAVTRRSLGSSGLLGKHPPRGRCTGISVNCNRDWRPITAAGNGGSGARTYVNSQLTNKNNTPGGIHKRLLARALRSKCRSGSRRRARVVFGLARELSGSLSHSSLVLSLLLPIRIAMAPCCSGVGNLVQALGSGGGNSGPAKAVAGRGLQGV